MSSLRRLALLTGALVAAAAPSAQAAITSSQVTSSTATTYNLYDESLGDAAPANRRTFTGTAVGNTGDPVRLVCTDAQGDEGPPIGNTTLTVTGTWTVTARVPSWYLPCVPRALPNAPASMAPFAPGPVIWTSRVGTVVSSGKTTDWYTDDARPHGFVELDSLGSCGLCDMRWLDADSVASAPLFEWNASLGDDLAADLDGDGTGENSPTALVDGEAAYTAATVPSDEQGDPDFVPVTFSHDLDTTTGVTKTASTEALMTCSTPGCSGADVRDTGVRTDRATRVDHDGQMVRITDTWRNTAGTSRELDLRYYNQQYDPDAVGTGVQLPGEAAIQPPRRLSRAGLPDTNVSSIAVSARPGEPADALQNPVGTITSAPTADEIVFGDDKNVFALRHRFTLAPGAKRTITHVYSMAGTLAATRELAAQAERMLTPAPPYTPPPSPAPPAQPQGPIVQVTPLAPPTVRLLSGRRKPKATRRGSTFVIDTGLDVACPAGGASCTTTVVATANLPKARAAARRTVGRARISVRAGRTAKVTFRLTPAGARRLRAKRSLKLALTLTSKVGPAGRATTAKRSIGVKAPARKRRR